MVYTRADSLAKCPIRILDSPGDSIIRIGHLASEDGADPFTRVSDQTCHYNYNLPRSCVVLDLLLFHHLDDSIILPLFNKLFTFCIIGIDGI